MSTKIRIVLNTFSTLVKNHARMENEFSNLNSFRRQQREALRLTLTLRMVKYSWPLNSGGLSCVGPLIADIFSINTTRSVVG